MLQYVEPGKLPGIPDEPPRGGDHFWITQAVYRVTDPTQTSEVLLDVVGPGCYFCEEPYSPRLATRRCRGHGTGLPL